MPQKTVLIVDDDKEIISEIQTLLSEMGVKVVTAQDGLSGLRVIRNQHIDAITLDLFMPVLDGFKVARLFKFDERYEHIPVIAISHLSQKHTEEVTSQMGFNAFLQKPIDPQQLKEVMGDLLSQTPGPPQESSDES